MRKIFLRVLIITSAFFIGCANDEDSSLNSGCKICDDFTSTGAVLEICDRGDDTAEVTITLSGIIVHNDIIETESGNAFFNLDCSEINIDEEL